MSPLLQISLALVFLLWVLPLTQGVLICIRGLIQLSRKSSESTGEPSTKLIEEETPPRPIEVDQSPRRLEDDRSGLRKLPFPEEPYQTLRNDVIHARAVFTHAVDTQKELEQQIAELSEKLQQQLPNTTDFSVVDIPPLDDSELDVLVFDSAGGELSVAYRLRVHGLRSRIARMQQQLDALLPIVDPLRADLEEKELALQKAYPLRHKSVAGKSESARAQEALSDFVRLQKEDDIKKRELFAKESRRRAKFLLESRHLLDAVQHQSMRNMRLEGMKQCMDTIHRRHEQIFSTNFKWEEAEEFLSEKLASFEEELQLLRREREEAEQLGSAESFEEADTLLLEQEVQVSKYRLLLDDSIKQRIELNELRIQFEKIRAETLMKIVEIDPGYLDFRPQ